MLRLNLGCDDLDLNNPWKVEDVRDILDYLPAVMIVVPTLIALAVCLSGVLSW